MTTTRHQPFTIFVRLFALQVSCATIIHYLVRLGHQVSHTAREKVKLLNRVRRIRGQIEAVERALEQEIGCADVLQLIAGARGAINGLMAEVMEDHIRLHVVATEGEAENQRAQAAEELIEVVRSYLK
jgi:DNA-binding FrmR family transcriptional regulator